MRHAIKLCQRYLTLQDAAPKGSLASELPGRISTQGFIFPADSLRRVRVMQIVHDLREYCQTHGINMVDAMEKAIDKF